MRIRRVGAHSARASSPADLLDVGTHLLEVSTGLGLDRGEVADIGETRFDLRLECLRLHKQLVHVLIELLLMRRAFNGL